MKKIIPLFLVLGMGFLSFTPANPEPNTAYQQRNNDRKISERRQLGQFTRIQNLDGVDIHYYQESVDMPVLSLVGLQSDIAKIETRVENGVLIVSLQKGTSLKKTPHVDVYSKKLSSYEGNGNFLAKTQMSSKNLTLELKGAANLKIDKIYGDSVRIIQNGTGQVDILELDYKVKDIQQNGKGVLKINGTKLKSK